MTDKEKASIDPLCRKCGKPESIHDAYTDQFIAPGAEPMTADGYPEEWALDLIRRWPHDDFIGLVDWLKDLWIYKNYIDDRKDAVAVSTGGWSGHEEIIAAMEENHLWWALHWLSSRRGGHYEFRPIYKRETLR